MVNDPMFIFAGILAFYAVIWLFYGMIHFNVPRKGLGLIGYVAVAATAVLTVFFIGYAFVAPEVDPIAGLPH